MNWITVALIMLSIMIAWSIWKWHKLDSETKANLRGKLGFFSVLALAAVAAPVLSGESPPSVDDVGGGYPIILPEESLNQAERALTHVEQTAWGVLAGDEDTWRSGALDFLNISDLNISNKSNISTGGAPGGILFA